MKKWKKFTVILVTAILAGSFLAGCGSSDSDKQETDSNTSAESEQQASDEKVTIRVADFSSSGAYWNEAFIVAYQNHLFDDAFGDKDVDVELIQFANGPAVTEAFIAGEVDMVNGIGDQPFIISVGNDVATTVLSNSAKQEKNIGIVAKADSGIASVDDLKGKRIGVYIGTYVHKSLIGVLGDNGISENDVEVVNITSTSDADAAFASGDIDAYLAMNSNYVIQRVGSGEFVKISDLTGHPAFSYIVADTNFVEKYPEITEELLAALKEAQDWIKENPEEAYELVAEYSDVDVEIVKNTIEGADVSLGLEDESIENLYNTYEFLHEYDMITNELTNDEIDSHIDRSFIDKVLGE